jgi:hypothetical protein
VSGDAAVALAGAGTASGATGEPLDVVPGAPLDLAPGPVLLQGDLRLVPGG